MTRPLSKSVRRDPEVCRVLHSRARWCYHHKCRNNVYWEGEVEQEELASQRLLDRLLPAKG